MVLSGKEKRGRAEPEEAKKKKRTNRVGRMFHFEGNTYDE